MEAMENEKLVQAMRASAPAQANPVIPQTEMERYPCSVRAVTLEVQDAPAVTVYLTVPWQVRSGAPMIVNYHGGGFIRGRSDRDELFCRRVACTFQAVVVDVDYALAPAHPHPIAIRQSKAAALWAKGQAASLDCDPDKLILLGQSAGGNLVANLCMAEAAEPALKPLCAAIAYAPMDLKTDPAEKPQPARDMPAERARNYNILYCAPETAEDPTVSPLFASEEMLRAFPPTLVITAGEDRLAPEGENFAIKLARAGVEVTCKRFRNCVHGFLINRMDAWEEGVELTHRFLSQQLQRCGQS